MPSVTGSDVVRALQRIGFSTVRVRGAHFVMKHADGRSTVVPVHRGEVLGPGILLKITHDADLTREQMLLLLRG